MTMRGILTYHSVDRSGSEISVTPEAFQQHIEWLSRGDISVVTLPELIALPDNVNAVAITFDDALESVATEAAPLLGAHGLPATVFVVSGRVGRDNRWSGHPDPGIPVQRVLDWQALARLQDQGFSIGAHSRSHRNLTECSAAEATDELVGSAEDIGKALGERPRAFAYPYGAFNPMLAEVVTEAFEIGCTTEFQPLHHGTASALIPRLDAWYFRDTARLECWGSRSFARWVAVRHALRRLRRIMT
ncbi:MAG: polysaccharide deacetylase family protein [Gemmatimonadales bacterium]|nr:polysaccharide deacetylase family protein [Gemmatimonadales bacterium]